MRPLARAFLTPRRRTIIPQLREPISYRPQSLNEPGLLVKPMVESFNIPKLTRADSDRRDVRSDVLFEGFAMDTEVRCGGILR